MIREDSNSVPISAGSTGALLAGGLPRQAVLGIDVRPDLTAS